MTRLSDARVLTRRATGYEPPDMDVDRVQAIISDRFIRGRGCSVALQSLGATASVEGYTTGACYVMCEASLGTSWNVEPVQAAHVYRAGTKVTSATSTTVSTVGMLLRACRKDDMLRRLTPERRDTYERIRKLREEMGKIPFNIVEALRELRSHG